MWHWFVVSRKSCFREPGYHLTASFYTEIYNLLIVIGDGGIQESDIPISISVDLRALEDCNRKSLWMFMSHYGNKANSSDTNEFRSDNSERQIVLKEFWLHNNSFNVFPIIWAPSSEFVSSSIPSWQILTAHAQPFSGARDLAFCLKVPLDSPLVWTSSGGSGETARMHRLAWTFAARIVDKYQIRLTRPIWLGISQNYE